MRTTLAILVLALVGCDQIESNKPERLPNNAKNIIDMGNGWVTFDLDVVGLDRMNHTDRYLYRRVVAGDSTIETITKVDTEIHVPR